MILSNILLIVHVVVAITIVALVILQQGKGSDMGASFGGGSSQSLFGARGSANFLSRLTSGLITFFFISSLVVAYLYTHKDEKNSVMMRSSVIQQIPEEESMDILVPADSELDLPVTPE